MRKIILIFTFGFLVISGFGQAPDLFRHQIIVRDAYNYLLTDQTVGIQISIRQGTETGTIVYQETFSMTTNTNGLVNFTIGAGNVVAGKLTTINWTNGPYFIESAIDPDNGNSYSLVSTSKMQSLPYAFYSNEAGFADVVDYNSLENQPQTITEEQSEKIDLLTVTSELNLNVLSQNIGLNNDKVSFPGFGNTAGKAYEIQWSKIGDDAFYLPGSVGLGVASSSGFGGSLMHVGGGILYNGTPTDSTGGLLFYDSDSQDGIFTYFDNSKSRRTIGRNIDFKSTGFIGIYGSGGGGSVNPLLGVRSTYDIIVKNHLAIGHGATSGYNYHENTMVLADNIIRMKFWDTSSSSFPSTDWHLLINDTDDGGENYFAIQDVNSSWVPFKQMAGAPDNSLFINANGNIGLGNNTPSEKLDVSGTVSATFFHGEVRQLTGLPGGTGLIENTGSTTLLADSDDNLAGDLIFQTKNTNRMVISNSGFVGIGNNSPGSLLDISGTSLVTGDLNVENNIDINGEFRSSVYNDPTSSSAFMSYNVIGKQTVIFNPTSGAISILSLISGKSGQKVTLINKSSTYDVTIYSVSNGGNVYYFPSFLLTLSQNESATFVCNGAQWYVTDIVSAP